MQSLYENSGDIASVTGSSPTLDDGTSGTECTQKGGAGCFGGATKFAYRVVDNLVLTENIRFSPQFSFFYPTRRWKAESYPIRVRSGRTTRMETYDFDIDRGITMIRHYHLEDASSCHPLLSSSFDSDHPQQFSIEALSVGNIKGLRDSTISNNGSAPSLMIEPLDRGTL
ncbi:hypothetical protein PIB30_079070 [Stylosanthes scabra]|uniref:Uncharacterized protein n=1 Tax=Stylosanthes scabra TaxID=79078 RepID=A0ABU6QQP8_9FABA|nr:hypothetical protein [Stylosanthes scabra]